MKHFIEKWLTRAIAHYKVLLFPLVITVILCTFTIMGLSGSSVNSYDLISSQQDTPLLGHPQPVRSDEWLVNTPLIVAQSKANFPKTNNNIGDGQNMALVVDVPYYDWSMLFRPQNLPFFALPLEEAFAMKWWLLAWMLMMSVYCFFLTLSPRRYLLASLLAVSMCLNPFIQWWYQSITILPIAYSFILLTVFWRMLDSSNSLRRRVVYAGVAGYVLVCMALLLYPAFVIPCLLFVVCMSLAIVKSRSITIKAAIKKLWADGLIIIALVLVPLLSFFVTNSHDITTIRDTVYPGSRHIQSGGADAIWLLTWPLDYLLLSGMYAQTLPNNQSELSSFVLAPLFVLPFLWLCLFIQRKKPPPQTWYIIACSALLAVILARMFIVESSWLFSAIGFGSVPHARLMIILGMIGSVILYSSATLVPRTKLLKSSFPAIVVGVVITATLGICLLVVKERYGLSYLGAKEVGFVAGSFGIAAALLFGQSEVFRTLGVTMIVFASLTYSITINPLTMGMGDTVSSNFVKTVSEIERTNSSYWVVDDSPSLSSLLVSSGAETRGGVMTYPNSSTIARIFADKKMVFNRYAHVRFDIDNTTSTDEIKLIQTDSYIIRTHACSKLLRELQIDYIVTENAFNNDSGCFREFHHIPWGEKTIKVYKRM